MPRYRDPPIIVTAKATDRDKRVSEAGYRGHAAVALRAIALVIAGGGALNLVVLWFLQRSPGDPTWAFFAIANTVEGLPLIALGVAMAILALFLAGSRFLLAYRFLGCLLVGCGLAALVLALLSLLGYLAIRDTAPAGQQTALLAATLKTSALGILQAIAFVPSGWLCLGRPA